MNTYAILKAYCLRHGLEWRFDTIYSPLHLIWEIIKLLNQVVKDMDELKIKMDDLIQSLEGTIEQKVIDQLQVWLNDGTLAQLVNDVLLEQKLDKIVYDQFLIDYDNDQTEIKNFINKRAVYVTDPPYNAKGDGVTDDTLAIQMALNNEYHVIIPRNKLFLISGLTMPKVRQELHFEANARFRTTGANVIAIEMLAEDQKIYNPFIACEPGTIAAIRTTAFKQFLFNPYITGTMGDGIIIDGIEGRIENGITRGASNGGLVINAVDLFVSNFMTQQNRHGVIMNAGSVTAQHVHAIMNSMHGFYIQSGSAFSQLTQCYSDTNGGAGYTVGAMTSGLTMIDCWGYKSSNIENNFCDFEFYGSKNVKLIGCRASGVGGGTKLSSFKFDTESQVDLIGCYATATITAINGIHELIRLSYCTGSLANFSRSSDVIQGTGLTVASGTPVSTGVLTTLTPITTTPGIMSFKVRAVIRNTDNTGARVEEFVINYGLGMTTSIQNIGTTTLTLSNVEFVESTALYRRLKFDVTNTGTKTVQVAFNFEYLGSTRGYN